MKNMLIFALMIFIVLPVVSASVDIGVYGGNHQVVMNLPDIPSAIINYSTITTNLSYFWGNYLYSDYNMPNILGCYNNASYLSTFNTTYDTSILNLNGNHSAYLSIINSSYALTSAANATFNQTLTDSLYITPTNLKTSNFQMTLSGKISGWAGGLGAGTALTPVGLAAFSFTGSPATSPSPIGFTTNERWIVYPSAATVNTWAGMTSTALTEGTFQYLPRMVTKFATDDLNRGNRTIWIALSNATLVNINGTSATTSPSYIGIRFMDENTTRDATWQCCSGNLAGTCISITNAAMSYNSTWIADIGYMNTTTINCTIWNSTNAYSITKNTNLPLSTQSFGLINGLTTEQATARRFYVQWIYMEMN